MSYLPSQVTKAKKLREEFRKAKRKQFASISAVIVVVIALGAFAIVLGLFVRSLFNQDTSIPNTTFVRQQPGTTLTSTAWSTVFQPAPWFVMMGDDRLVIAGDTAGGKAGFPSMPVNFLAGYSKGAEGPNWRRDFNGPLTSLDIAQDQIIAFRQMLSEPPGIELSGYSIEDGSQTWTFAIELAEKGHVEIAGNVVCLTYQMPDGPRIAGYNCETGTKAWGLRIPLDADNPGTALTDHVYLEALGGGYLAYYVDRFFGLLDTSTGKLVRKYDSPGSVIDAATSWDEAQVFLLESGLSENDYRLVTFPFRDGNPLVVHEYQAAAGSILLCSGLYAILVFSEPASEGGEAGSAFVAGFTPEPSGPKFLHKLPPGYVDEATAIPGAAGEFLLASNSGANRDGVPSGKGRLLRVKFSNQSLNEVASFNQAVNWLVPFKNQCVVLLQGGRVISYINELDAAVSIGNLRFANLDPAMNQARDCLAVLSYQNSYAAGESGGMLDVTVFE